MQSKLDLMYTCMRHRSSIELSVRVTVVELTTNIRMLVIIQVVIFILSSLPMMVVSGKMVIMLLASISSVSCLLNMRYRSIWMRTWKELRIYVMGPLRKQRSRTTLYESNRFKSRAACKAVISVSYFIKKNKYKLYRSARFLLAQTSFIVLFCCFILLNSFYFHLY